MNTTEKVLLRESLKICTIHANRIQSALNKIEHLYPFTEKTVTDINTEDLAFLDVLTTRFCKLQDTLGEKVFTLLLESLGELVMNKSFIDKLNKLEKIEILPSADWWQDLRRLRNVLTHEYPDDPAFIAENLNNAFIQAKKLLHFWEHLNAHTKANVLKD
jgi:hypothetical protein